MNTRESKVYFFLDDCQLCRSTPSLDLERDWAVLKDGVEIWILQSYLHLKRKGYPVVLTQQPPERGTVVVHFDQTRALLEKVGWWPQITIVSVRADRRANRYADLEVVQNDRFADEIEKFFVPHWPQPSLIPREASRCSRVENIAFVGDADNLHSDFASSRWLSYIRESGLGWCALGGSGLDGTLDPSQWNDFSTVDIVLAARQDYRNQYVRKPALKLINAWHAGVPAILGPEYAYRQLRRSRLDYMEVESVEAAISAVQALRDDPSLYMDMVANGLERAREYTPEVILDRWEELLFRDAIPASTRRRIALTRWIPIGIRHRMKRRQRVREGDDVAE